MTRISATGFLAAAAACSLVIATGCTTKNYARNQVQPVVQQTNELDRATGQDQQNIRDTDARLQSSIQQTQNQANAAQQSAENATQAANGAHQAAEEAVNRADSLEGVLANLENYKQVSGVSVTFGFNKSTLTSADRQQLDQFGSQLAGAKNYILAVTGGTDSIGSKEYNYQLSDRRAMSVVQYLASRYNVPAHKFYLIGLGKDQEVAPNNTPEGRRKNRRVEVQLLSDTTGQSAPTQSGSIGSPASAGSSPSMQ